jgi:YD repeat-containing protein
MVCAPGVFCCAQLLSYNTDSNITEQSDGNGNITRHDYNAFNEHEQTTLASETLVQQTLSFEYDQRGNLVRQKRS